MSRTICPIICAATMRRLIKALTATRMGGEEGPGEGTAGGGNARPATQTFSYINVHDRPSATVRSPQTCFLNAAHEPRAVVR